MDEVQTIARRCLLLLCTSLACAASDSCWSMLCAAFKCNSTGPSTHLLTIYLLCLQPQITKPFDACSLADFAHGLQLNQLAARDASGSGSARCADVVARITPGLLDHAHTKAVLQRHPCVGGSDGLVRQQAGVVQHAARLILQRRRHSVSAMQPCFVYTSSSNNAPNAVMCACLRRGRLLPSFNSTWLL